MSHANARDVGQSLHPTDSILAARIIFSSGACLKMRQFLLLLAASLSLAAADITPGKSLTQGNVTIVLTRFSNRPSPDTSGLPQPPAGMLKEGVTVSVTSTNQAVTTFKVVIKYHGDGDSLLSAT